MQPIFTGVCTALVTPFSGDSVDLDALDRLIDRQLDAGVDALLACGTTGEPSALSDEEWRAVVERTVQRAGSRALVIAGTGTNNLSKTISRAQLAHSLGARAQLCVTPYYNKTTQDGLIAYFSRITKESPLPVILYNVPGRTGLNMLPATVQALSRQPRIIGIKEAGSDLGQLSELLRVSPLPLYCGNDSFNAPALQLGASGLISVLSNICPQSVVHLYAAMKKGSVRTANASHQALMPLIHALFCEVSPIPVKTALHMMKLCEDTVRPPLISMQPRNALMLRSILIQEGWMPQ